MVGLLPKAFKQAFFFFLSEFSPLALEDPSLPQGSGFFFIDSKKKGCLFRQLRRTEDLLLRRRCPLRTLPYSGKGPLQGTTSRTSRTEVFEEVLLLCRSPLCPGL